ncbi:hypothetical protein HRW23_33280 [Streptomyces lunaelactis]|uniref:hypothetical protein n=1 Tax=Streptomyces lunaelactis TaxID=1535768 RepID=UPI001584BE8F|nr:hypothetical protein [Streptomyces lunaelactis]NUK25184.1 hypothetical protein [Streptomyces lunaelactis]NUK50927.1 hypothetical protein [Streptomyces lunaelactis]NUK64041.1 hypothetical protein [Streptomyces lunaelactis]NUK82154.1 hypothetical protein [Streptomyces lunaelactis]
MRQNVGLAVPLAALVLLTACGRSAGGTHPCTLMDAPAGIQVEVDPELANRTDEATLTACWDGTCRKRTLQLRETWSEEPATPGNPVMTTESVTATESPAASTPQTPEPFAWPGFAVVRDLPKRPIHITLVFKNQRGATVLDRQISITPQPTYPNGRNCSPGGHQAHLTVTGEGSLIPR